MHEARNSSMKKFLLLFLFFAVPYFLPAQDFVPFTLSTPIGTNCIINISLLHPLQSVVGRHEVELRAAKLKKKSAMKLEKYLQDPRHIVPVVIGPGGTIYVTDHHHLCCALIESGVRTSTYAVVKASYIDFTTEKFWQTMKVMNWVYTRDENGHEIRIPDELPKTMYELRDDPYRSLAWMVRSAGGYFYTDEDLPDFQWANFFRARIKFDDTSEKWERALADAMKICHSDAAKDLPGYTRETKKDAQERD